MTTKRDRAIDIASEMARHIDAGSSQEEIDASIRRAFPGVTVELDRARAIGFDQIDQIAMWFENEDARPEDVSVFDLMMSGAPATKIDAAIACGNGTRSPQLRNYGANQMLDTSQITTEFTRLITTGTYEQAMLVAVAQLFPELTAAELSQALQVATAAAEKPAVRRH